MKARSVVLDTETTGLDASSGDRILEIGCVELVNFVVTGRVFHKYINPERDIPAAATRIHGITADMVKDQPKFAEVADEFLDFIQDSTLIIHNAGFDMRFIEAEMEKVGKANVVNNPIVDTLEAARKKFPGTPVSLDALCKRFNIAIGDRKFHGALKDANLLARVYVELCGGVQRSLGFAMEEKESAPVVKRRDSSAPRKVRVFTISDQERLLHMESISKMKDPLWNIYLKNDPSEAVS
ncbi:MAG: DNA polymerase III subunit epsilon [Anaplasma sp.]